MLQFGEMPVVNQLLYIIIFTIIMPSIWASLKTAKVTGSSAEPVDMSSSVAQFVKDTIASEPIVIFSKTYCPYCKMAKQVFDTLKESYVAVELDKRDDAEDIQKVLGEITGAKTVPRVFYKGECLGGGTDVKALHDNGKLKQLLQA